MSDRIKSNHNEAAHLQALTAQQHHTQQTVKSQKLQHTKMQQLRVRHNLMQAKFALNKKWAHNHAAAARGAAAQKVMARFGAKPTPKGAAGKGALRGKEKDKELHEKELPHDKELDKDLHEQQMPREREVLLPKEKEKERDKDRQPQQDQRQQDKEKQQEKQQNKERQPERERQPEKERERQKDGEPQQNRNGNGGDDGHGGQQQQQQPQQQSQQQSQQQPQQDGQQQQRQHKQREGKDGESGGAKFAVTGRKISTSVKVPENFQALGAKLGQARATDTHRVLLQTFAKVILRHAAQLSGGFALAPLMVLAATSPGAMKRKPARMQSQIASAMFNQQRAAAGGATPAKASAGVGILSHTLDLTLARQRFGVGYSIDDQSMLSVRQMMIDVKASMPTLAASNGVTTASDKSPEVRVAPTAPGSQT